MLGEWQQISTLALAPAVEAMTIREFTCLIRLFQACADPAIRCRAVELVPELAEWDEKPPEQHLPVNNAFVRNGE